MTHATYYRIPGGFIGVTDEGPKKGPMKGLVLVGRGPKPGRGPESVYEQAYAISELQKLCEVRLDEVPDDWVLAIGYDPLPVPQPEEIRVEFLPEVFGPSVPQPKRYKNVLPNYWPLILSAALFVAAVLFFHWLKR